MTSTEVKSQGEGGRGNMTYTGVKKNTLMVHEVSKCRIHYLVKIDYYIDESIDSLFYSLNWSIVYFSA